MLTPEEFAKLTAQGVLKFNPPKTEPGTKPITPVTKPVVPQSTATTALPKSPSIQALTFKNTSSEQLMDVS